MIQLDNKNAREATFMTCKIELKAKKFHQIQRGCYLLIKKIYGHIYVICKIAS